MKLPDRATYENLVEFADMLQEMQSRIGYRYSSRGWCYLLEVEGTIDKSQFDRVQTLVNNCRKRGILPIDFTAEEEGRQFSGVITPNTNEPVDEMKEWVEYLLDTETFGYNPDFWDGEEYYIQMLVEKIDLKTLFEPICKQYKIPIATSKGWSSMLQRAVYAKRFRQAEDDGLKPVLLYCGDMDPDGLRISKFIRDNLQDLANIEWKDGTGGYDPDGLEITRFGLNADFIEEHKLTWINNLITGGKKNLASPTHKNYHMPYVQNYIKRYGIRKCEANALSPYPKLAQKLVKNSIESYLGKNAKLRFDKKVQAVKEEIQHFRKKSGLDETLRHAIEMIENIQDE